MAESPDMDFRTEYSPAIAEVQCPSTPGPQLNIKSPDLSTSSSSEETEVARGDGTQSPPPNCAICLGRCRNKCFTDSCMHQFCFKCLLEWSKVKPECPLCKQTFKAIIHNVKSIDQFEEYLVQQPAPVSPNPDAYPPFTIPAHLYQRLPSLYNGRVNLYMDDLAMNTLDLTGTSSSTSNANQDAHRPPSYRRILPGPAQLLDMYSQETIQGETGSGSLSQLWRRYVYDRKLYALPMPDITGRLRESSARYYRDYPTQIHRLMPWINRDIVCLLRNTEHDVSAVMEQINSMLMTCNILSPDFRRRLQPFLGTKTVHFIHELNNFARSPFDMIGYDRLVQYSTNNAEEIVIEFSSTSSAGSDVESVNNDIEQDATTNRRVNHQANTTNANSGGGFNLYTTTITSTSSQASAINLSTHNRGVSGDISEGTTTTSTVEVVRAPTSERPTNIVLSSTSSDECEFVLEQKPPHLRTPEMVSLNSNSDSDVVFVQETKTTPMPSGIAKWASTNSARVRRAQRRRANPSLNTHSFSTSNSDSDGYTYGEPSTPKKIKVDAREENAAADATATSTAVSKPANDQLPKVKEEFNQGASTSTGLQSRYRSARPNITRSRRYMHDETSDSDTLDDSSSPSTASYFTTHHTNSTSDSDTSWSKSRRSSNKQSLKRSRQQKASATNSRKSRRQLAASSKSKRSKRTKTSKSASNKSSSSTKKKKASKRSRRKSPKSKTGRRKRQSAPSKDDTTSEEEEEQQQLEYVEENADEQPSSCRCKLSPSDECIYPIQMVSDDELQRTPSELLRSATSSPVSNSTTSDANDAIDDASSSAPLAAGDDSFNSIDPALLPAHETSDNPNANLAIYSDTD